MGDICATTEAVKEAHGQAYRHKHIKARKQIYRHRVNYRGTCVATCLRLLFSATWCTRSPHDLIGR